MTKLIARILSLLLHPLLIPSWGFLVLFLSNTFYGQQSAEFKTMIWLLIFAFTFLIPAILIVLLKLLGVIQSLEMENHTERIYPMMITFLSYFACVFVLRHFNAPIIIPLIITGAIISVGMAGMISIVWKISAHLTGFGGLIATILIMSVHLQTNLSMMVSISIILGGFLAWSRIYLKSHDITQVFSGFILGFASLYLLIFLAVVK